MKGRTVKTLAVTLVTLAVLANAVWAKPCPKCGTENDELAKFCKSGCGFEFGKAGDKVYVKGLADKAFDAGKWESAKRLYTLLLSLDPGNPLAAARKTECDRKIAEERARLEQERKAREQRDAEERARIAREQHAREEAARAAGEQREFETWVAGERKNRAFNVDTAKGALELGDHAGAARYALKALVGNWDDAEATQVLREALEKGTPAQCCDVEGAFGSAPVSARHRAELKREGAKACAGIALEMAAAVEGRGDKKGALGFFTLARQWDPTDARAQVGVQRCTPPPWEVEMVSIPGGIFQMGSDDGSSDEKPVHSVTVSSFSMGKYEVTQEQYEAVMGRNPSDFKGAKRPVEQVSWYDAVLFCNRLSLKAGLGSCYYMDKKLSAPVVAEVTKGDIYCDWSANGYRLPTEAEWEYACRAGTRGPFHTGSCLSTTEANYDGNFPYFGCRKGQYRQSTWDVGSGAKNAWGLFDMHGNVWEWCWDWYDDDYYKKSPSTDPQGPSSGSNRVGRGGCWFSGAGSCRSAYRLWLDPDGRGYGLGFRLVRR